MPAKEGASAPVARGPVWVSSRYALYRVTLVFARGLRSARATEMRGHGIPSPNRMLLLHNAILTHATRPKPSTRTRPPVQRRAHPPPLPSRRPSARARPTVGAEVPTFVEFSQAELRAARGGFVAANIVLESGEKAPNLGTVQGTAAPSGCSSPNGISSRNHLKPGRYHPIPRKYHAIHGRNRLISDRYHMIPREYQAIRGRNRIIPDKYHLKRM
uniref:Uncharacterized protein n=1 Tax=Oryza meridionalis TaxID=40149 RepID=A0A0E0C6M0_9ORYZ